jgi:hypothetical protein
VREKAVPVSDAVVREESPENPALDVAADLAQTVA